MTTYYGVWSGKEWWNVGNGVFLTTTLGLALAQAIVVNAMWDRTMRACSRRDEHWEARAIGEDGLPRQRSRLIVYEPCDRERGRIGCVCPRCELERSVAESNATKLTEAAAPRQCAMCGESPPVWVSMEPFCPDCHAWLEKQDDVHMLLCPGCGKTLQDTEAPRRGRRNHES